MKAVVRKGLVAPGVVAVMTLFAWLVAGPVAALAVLAVGAGWVIARHLVELQRLTEWASGALEEPVPEGQGAWTDVFAAMYRRTRLRVAMQRELKLLVERFRRAAEAMPDGVLLLDRQNRIDWANPKAMEQLGLEMPDDRGQPLVNLVRSPEFLRYVAEGDYTEPIVIASLRDRRRFSLQLVPFGIEEKLLLSRDVTQLEAVARMRRDFIASVSHELKTPLTVVSGFIETLQDLDLDSGQRERYLGLMQDQARNMQRLVSDLLTLSALESDSNPAHEGEFEVEPLLRELASDARALSRGEHAIVVDVASRGTVNGNRDELRSAVGNLVSNAVRYTPRGGTITLGWHVDADGSGVFSVRDTGIGIAEEHIPRLTERFYRVDRSRSRATGGTGLGLAIVKHVLMRHQAELEVTSRPGEGSTFAVRLPARRVRRGAGASTRPEAAVSADAATITNTSTPPDTAP